MNNLSPYRRDRLSRRPKLYSLSPRGSECGVGGLENSLSLRGVPQCQLKLKEMLMRSASMRLGGTSWRSQLSNRMTLPASAG